MTEYATKVVQKRFKLELVKLLTFKLRIPFSFGIEE